MTVANNYQPIRQLGNGVTTDFSFNFKVLDDEQIVVYELPEGGEQQVVDSNEYTVNLTNSGGNVVFDTAPATGTVIVITRLTPQTQETPYKTSQGFPAAVVEGDFDKLTMMVQELQQDSDRSVKVDVTSGVTPDVLVNQVERIYESVDNIDTVADDISNVNTTAGSIANVNTTAGAIANVNTVAGIASDVTTVAGIASDVSGVAQIATQVSDVYYSRGAVENVANNVNDVVNVSDNMLFVQTSANNIGNINTVGNNISDVNTTAGSIANVNAVAGNASNINAVAGNASNINTVAGNANDINAVAADLTNIDNVAGDLTNINDVAGDLTNIDAVNANKTNIDTVAGISSNVTTVAGISSDVTSVAGNNTDISSVAADLTNINSVASDLTNIDNVAGDLTNINAVAADLTNIDNASQYAAEAKQWAIGDPSEPSGNSAKYWAEQAAGKANTDLSNLTADGKNIANWSTNVTNCITKIPQDIKLELNNGTVTLKAGSKVYVPNGAGVFDEVTVASDVVFHSGTIGTATINMMLCCNLTGGYGIRAELDTFVSSATAPSDTTKIWYDTTNNAIKKYEDGSWVRAYSLPVGIYVRTNGVATAIDQVFNGFGYIGSTIFALPGVKGLIPNGRNDDGTLNNNQRNITSVKTLNCSSSGNRLLAITGNGKLYDVAPTTWTYDEQLNRFKNSSGTAFSPHCIGGSFTTSSGVITSLTPKTAFHALDYNDSSTISGWGMPSDRYIDLTFGASGATYTAPANGWFSAVRVSSAGSNNFLRIINTTSGVSLSFVSDSLSNAGKNVFVPAAKDDIIEIEYGSNSSATSLRFIYAEGEQ